MRITVDTTIIDPTHGEVDARIDTHFDGHGKGVIDRVAVKYQRKGYSVRVDLDPEQLTDADLERVMKLAITKLNRTLRAS